MGVTAAVLLYVGAAFVAALALTPVVRLLALRAHAVARPSTDRWHKRPTALWGGVAIALGTAAGLAVATRFADDAWAGDAASLGTSPVFGVVLSAGFMFVAGLVDDMVRLKPQAKFLLQLVAGVILLSFGAGLSVTPLVVVNIVATLFWFVALTHAFDLLGGLDGGAARGGAIAALYV